MDSDDQSNKEQHLRSGYEKARIKRKDLDNSLPQLFTPFYEYFDRFRNQYLLAPKPTKWQGRQNEQKMQLSLQKQMDYYRGASKVLLQQQFLRKVLEEEDDKGGLVDNIKNRCYFKHPKLYYAMAETLKCCELQQKDLNISLNNFVTLHTLCQPICEITPASLHVNLVAVRCRYWIYIIDLESNEIKGSLRMNEEVTSICWTDFNSSFFITTYDGSHLKYFQLTLENCLISNQSSLYESKWFAHSCLALNRRQLLAVLGNKIIINDWRKSKQIQIKRINDVTNDRYIGFTTGLSKNQFIFTRRRNIEVVDFRKDFQIIKSIRHMCDESPPSCLQTLSFAKLLIAYSPHRFGSSLLIQLDNFNQQFSNQVYKANNKNVHLLFDSGKLFESIYPHSISYFIQNQQINFLHIDSSEGIFLQTYKKHSESQQLMGIQSKYQKECPNPNQLWLKQQVLAPYLKKKQLSKLQQKDKHQGDNDEEDEQEDEEEEEEQKEEKENNEQDEEDLFFKRKVYYCSLNRFYESIKKSDKRKQVEKQNSTFPNTWCSQHQYGYNDFNMGDLLQKSTSITSNLIQQAEQSWQI